MIIALLILLLSLCVAWVVGFGYLIVAIKRLPVFRNLQAPMPGVWPRLSVVIPACNEAATLESAVATLLQEDYPDLEIVLVDDRSTDGTGELIDRLAHQDPRIHTVHIGILPQGWLGKVHALHRGVEQASGAWLLFTDADVHFAAGTLRHAIAVALHQRVDHLTLIPRAIQKSFWLDVAVNTFGLLFFITTRAGSVNRPHSKAFVGIGAFNLVSAWRFHQTVGFEWLRLEPGDDVGLGMIIKQAGGTTRLALAYEDLSVQWYASVAAMFKGLEKNLFRSRLRLPLVANASPGGDDMGASCGSLFFFGARPRAWIRAPLDRRRRRDQHASDILRFLRARAKNEKAQPVAVSGGRALDYRDDVARGLSVCQKRRHRLARHSLPPRPTTERSTRDKS